MVPYVARMSGGKSSGRMLAGSSGEHVAFTDVNTTLPPYIYLYGEHHGLVFWAYNPTPMSFHHGEVL